LMSWDQEPSTVEGQQKSLDAVGALPDVPRIVEGNVMTVILFRGHTRLRQYADAVCRPRDGAKRAPPFRGADSSNRTATQRLLLSNIAATLLSGRQNCTLRG
jgi:hypothetical protein